MHCLPALTEFAPLKFDKHLLHRHEAELLWQQYEKVVKVDYPSPRTGNQWQLTAQGWCGFLPLAEGRGLELRPKVPVLSVWRMLNYAYFTQLHLFDSTFTCRTMPDLIERLAAVLSKRVLDRARRGLYRTYVSESGRLPCVRGRIDINQAMRKPWIPEPHCHYQRHTSDNDENRILTWTLERIARSGLCHERNEIHPSGALPAVRQAYRVLSGATSVHPFTSQDCLGRRYNRLSADYCILHSLCRFFLDSMSPSHLACGENGADMLPFLIPMEKLFQDYVAEWLRRHLDINWHVERQERYDIGDSGQNFQIDLVLYDPMGQARYVVDTKYKSPKNGRPTSSDISQVIAYAVAKKCREAVLLYPTTLSFPLDAIVNGIRVRTLTFSLQQDSDEAGRQFLWQLKMVSLGDIGS